MNLFNKKNNLYLFVIIGVICFGINFLILMMNESNSIMDYVVNLVVIILLLWVSYAYYNKQKEVLKGLSVAMITLNFSYTLACIDFLSIVEEDFPLDMYIGIVFIILAAIVFVIHMMINKTNNPSPKLVKINQFFILLLDLIILFISIKFILNGDRYYILWIIPYVGIASMYNTIICIEGRVEYHREQRVKSGD